MVQQLIAAQIAKVSMSVTSSHTKTQQLPTPLMLALALVQLFRLTTFMNLPDSEQGLFGWIGAPASGLWADRQALIGQADSADVKKLESKYVRAASGVCAFARMLVTSRRCGCSTRTALHDWQVASRIGRTAAARSESSSWSRAC